MSEQRYFEEGTEIDGQIIEESGTYTRVMGMWVLVTPDEGSANIEFTYRELWAIRDALDVMSPDNVDDEATKWSAYNKVIRSMGDLEPPDNDEPPINDVTASGAGTI